MAIHRTRCFTAFGKSHKCKREGTHFVAVNPSGTTKGCASYGVSTDKPLWVREQVALS